MAEFEKCKEELLDSLNPTENTAEKTTKRGSKNDLIEKIHKVCDENDIICEYSTTQLKRSTKTKLAEILAELIEKAMEQKIREQIKVKSIEGATPEQNQQLVALGTLRLLHDSLARATEVGVDRFTNYELSGFTQSMKEPTISEQIDDCLMEIAEEYTDVVEMISSPYTKLALIWSTSAAATAKRKSSSLQNTRNDRSYRTLGPKPTLKKETVDSGVSGRKAPRKVSYADPLVKIV